jgi:hypothetical protein
MTLDGGERVMDRILILFPTLVGDPGKQAMLLREMDKFSEQTVMCALDDYVVLGEKYLNPAQLMAIAFRHDRQQQERDALEERMNRLAAERDSHGQKLVGLASADQVIVDMTDDEVMREWRPVLDGMKGKAREWAEKWPAATIRTNIQFRLKMAQLLGDA